jgi:hypothetical protein
MYPHMVPFIAHIELKCIMVAIKEGNCQSENYQYNEYCLRVLIISRFRT